MYLHETFLLVKRWGVTQREKEGVGQKLLNPNHKMRFFGSFFRIFSPISKNIMYLMQNIVLHYCSKFEKNLNTFGGVMAKKPPKSTQKWYFLLVGKHLKIHNLPTINSTPIKLTRIMCLHETFHLARNWGVTHRAWERVVKKPAKNSMKLTNFPL